MPTSPRSDPGTDPRTPPDVLVRYATHVAENVGLYRSALGEHGSPVAVTRLRRRIAALAAEGLELHGTPPALSGLPVPIAAAALAGSVIGVLVAWLERDPLPPAGRGLLGLVSGQRLARGGLTHLRADGRRRLRNVRRSARPDVAASAGRLRDVRRSRVPTTGCADVAGSRQVKYAPPLTSRTAPVTNDAPSEARNTTASAMSSGAPARFSAEAATAARCAGSGV